MTEKIGTVPVLQVEDKLTEKIGGFGKWHIFIYVILILPVKFTGYTMSLGIVFLAPKTTFRCIEMNSTQVIENYTCYMDCLKYEYYSQFDNTIISEWGLVCDRAWLADLVQTANMLGILVGSMIFGFVADRHGRRPAIIISSTIQLATSFGTAFCSDYWVFTCIRFLLGVATAGNTMTTFVMLTEIIGPSYREYFSCAFHVNFAVAQIVTPGIAYFLRSWDMFSVGVAAPTVVYLFYFFILPESPRWLISMGRLEEASVVMEKAAKFNGMPTDYMLETAKVIAQEANVKEEKQEQPATYIDLLQAPLRTKNICSCAAWFYIGLAFYGCSQYMGQTSSNVFITMTFAGVLMLISIIFSGYLFRRFGRRNTTIGFLLVSSVTNGLLALPENLFYFKVVAGAIGVTCLSGAFTTIYIFTSELFPTVTRNMAMGASSTASRVGSAVAPFIAGLKTEAMWLPPTIFAVIPLLAVASCYFLPETKGKKMTDTLVESQK